MNWKVRLMNGFLRLVFRMVGRIDVDELKKVPVERPIDHCRGTTLTSLGPVLIPTCDNPILVGKCQAGEVGINTAVQVPLRSLGVIPNQPATK